MKKPLVNYIDPHWRKVFSKYLSKGQKQKALSILDKIILSSKTLFSDHPQFEHERKIALLLRIDLLRSWHRDLEALAWLTLECELHPENKNAHLLKDQLKYELDLISYDDDISYNPTSYSDVLWPDFPGMRELKTSLQNEVINPVRNPVLFEKYKILPPNGIMFYGPPGCGKTFVARKLAKVLGYHFIEIIPSDIASPYVHGTQDKIRKKFDDALDNIPTLIFFDEFDGIAPNRDDTSHHYRSEVNEFLAQLDNLNEIEILVVGATNQLSKIDEAVLRPGRFDLKIFIPPPDFESRFEILKYYMSDREQGKINFIQLAEYTEYYTAAELRNIIDLASRRAAATSSKIDTNIIVDVILENPASLNEEKIEKYKNEI